MCVLLVLLICSVLWNGGKGLNGHKEKSVVPDTVRVTVVDTIPYYKPVPKATLSLGNITAKLPVSVPKLPENVPNIQDSTHIPSKSVPYIDNETNSHTKEDCKKQYENTVPDSIDVQIPITQTKYEGDTYTAYVSGYNASLDSLILRMPHETMTITKRPKPKRWSIGIQVGYGMTWGGTPQFAPYVGVGISCNLFSF